LGIGKNFPELSSRKGFLGETVVIPNGQTSSVGTIFAKRSGARPISGREMKRSGGKSLFWAEKGTSLEGAGGKFCSNKRKTWKRNRRKVAYFFCQTKCC